MDIHETIQKVKENSSEEDATCLLFDGGEATDDTAVELAKAMEKNTFVREVSLADCGLTDKAAFAMAEVLKKNSSLQYLGLGANDITEKGAAAIAEALKVNTTLTNLIFHSNMYGEEGAQAILDAMYYNSTLTEVSVKSIMMESLSKDGIIHRDTQVEILRLADENAKGNRTKIVEENKKMLKS